MFFKTKTRRRKTPRQTLSTEQLEPKAMFNAAPLQAEIGFEDRLSDDYDANDAVFQIGSSQNITCDVGFVGGGNHTCNADRIWTNGGASTLRLGGTAGPGRSAFMTGEDGRMIVHPQYNVGEEGRMIIHPQFRTSSTAGPGISMSLRSENRFVFDIPKNDGLLVPAGYDFASFDLEPNERVGGVGKGTFTTGGGGDSIIHPQFNVGEDGRMIVHPQYNVGEEGRMIIHPQFNVGEDGRMIVHPQYNVGEEGRMIIHPQFNVGEDAIPAGTIIPHEDSHHSAKDLIGEPPEPKIAPPAPHVSDRVAVIDGGSDRIEEVARTSSAPRLAVFARMGR